MKDYFHRPVLLNEVLDFLALKEGGSYVDGTLGGGGYSRVISQRIGPTGCLLSIDLDPLALDNFSKDKLDNTIVVNDNFANLENIVRKNKKLSALKFDGFVLDLGLSSAQLVDDERGFSFNSDRLDMSFGPTIAKDTAWIVNNYSLADLTRVIKDYGEESWAGKIAERIVAARRRRKIESGRELADLVAEAIPKKFWRRHLHPATKTFQALRIETNDELGNLEKFLSAAIELLAPDGRIAVVAFHSLEDRIVKNFFRTLSRSEHNNFEVLNKKPWRPSEREMEENRRARSAKLRAIRKII